MIGNASWSWGEPGVGDEPRAGFGWSRGWEEPVGEVPAEAIPADAADGPVRIREEAMHRLRPLRQVAVLVNSRFTDPLTLADAAAAARLEATYFSRVFKQAVGVGFPAYLQLVRLEAAARLLATSDHSVLEVAHRCGFGSVRSMERASRRWLGCSPSDLRSKWFDHKNCRILHKICRDERSELF